MNLGASAIQVLLLTIFGVSTAVLAAVIGPTYDNLLVPSLATGALYPSLSAAGGTGFLGTAATFSLYLLANLVDPAVGLVAVGVGLLYLVRAFLGAYGTKFANLLPRLVVAVLVANLTLPLAGAILGLAGATYPVVSGFDGGAWQHWVNLGGPGFVTASWDNGALAFVLAFAIFSVVLLLAAAVAVRNALLGVLLVLLPVVTLLWPIPTLAPLARRFWLWFAELSFLPCAMVVPLELAVGSPSIVLTLGYLVVALAAPSLLSLGAGALTGAGMPSAGGAVAGGIQRGLLAASVVAEGWAGPTGALLKGTAAAGIAGSAQRSAGRAGPLALPAFSSEMLGHGSAKLFSHLARSAGRLGRGGGSAGGADGTAWSAAPVRSGDR
ncbi:MAG: hypothetical protein ACREC5_02735 [Thermoplasmata archaeon]